MQSTRHSRRLLSVPSWFGGHQGGLGEAPQLRDFEADRQAGRAVTAGDDASRDFKHEHGHDYTRVWVQTGDKDHWWIGSWGWMKLPDYEAWQGLNEGEP